MSKVQPAKVATIDEVKSRVAASTTAVVTDFQCNRTRPVLQLDEKLFCPRVLLHILDGFLRNAQ